MDTRVLRHDDAAHPKPGTAGGWTMRSMDGRPKRSCGLVFTLLASLLLGSAVASADVVLDWNANALTPAAPAPPAKAAATQAAYHVLSTYFPASASTLDTERATSLAQVPDGPDK